MVVISNFERTATFAWSNDKLPILATGSISGSISADFSSDSKLEFWSLTGKSSSTPLHTIETSSKFNDLDWSIDNKVLAGALDDGTVEFYSPPTETGDVSNSKIITSLKNHTTSVKTLKFNPKLSNVLISGDSKGLINVWDVNKIENSNYSPTQPGQSITLIDEIKSLAWNKSLSHVFANAGSSSGFASVWDLKTKKEVIHLSYTSPITNNKVPIDVIEWHPSNSTRVATASNTDLDPSILIWDLRQPNSPVTTLSNVHSKGVLSLDWCSQDSDLLISSGCDNTVVLWDPETLKTNLTVYPARSNWLYKTKFAPSLPDVFASAGFDNQIQVQTLQDLSNELDNLKSTQIINETEDDFWNTVSDNKKFGANILSLEKPKVNHIYAPKWLNLQKSPAAQWAFGGKLVSIGSDGKSIHINKPKTTSLNTNNDMLNNALTTKDFNPIINRRLNNSINSTNEEDWTFLEKLSMDGKQEFLKESLSFDDEEEEDEDNEETSKNDEGKEFFENLEIEQFDPTNVKDKEFKLDTDSNDIVKLLAKHEFSKTIDFTLGQDTDLLLESFIIALLSKNETLIKKSVSQYFLKYASKSSLSRYLFSLYSNSFEDLVENCDVSQWKYVAKTIQNYEKSEDLKAQLLTKLGDKVLASGNRQDALILYMSSNNLDKISGVWLNEYNELELDVKNKNGKSTTNYEAHLECLTEFVERFSCFSNSFNDGSKIKLENDELISKFLEFVNLISSNGDFDLALQFLNALPGENADVNTEKQRVLIASGKSQSTTAKTTTAASRITKKSAISGAPSNFIPSQPAQPAYPSMGGMNPAFVPAAAAPPSYAPQVVAATQQAPYSAPRAVSVANPYAPAKPVVPVAPQNANQYGPPPTKAGVAFSSPQRPQSTMSPVPQPAPIQPQVTASTVNPYQPPVATVIPATAPMNNTLYSPPLGAGNQAGYYNNGVNSPIPNTTSGFGPISGQTPSLNKKANEGWNDLDLPVKEKIVRAKPVITKPETDYKNNTSNSNHSPLTSNGINMPPPPTGSRVSSQSVPEKPPIKRVTSEASAKYAPLASSSSSQAAPDYGAAPSVPGLAPAILNPYAPPPQKPITPTVVNPYAPPPVSSSSSSAHRPSYTTSPVAHGQHSNKFVPSTASATSIAPPPIHGHAAAAAAVGAPPAVAPAVLPPPPMKRKSHAPASKNVDQAIADLDAIKQSTPVHPGETQAAIEHPTPVVAAPPVAPQVAAPVEQQQPAKTISEEEQQIIVYFKQELERVTPLVPQEYTKQLKDSNKRLRILFTHLENQDLLTQPVVAKVCEIIELMKTGKYAEAKAVQTDIATNHPEEAGNWLTGVKRLINIAEATAGTSSA